MSDLQNGNTRLKDIRDDDPTDSKKYSIIGSAAPRLKIDGTSPVPNAFWSTQDMGETELLRMISDEHYSRMDRVIDQCVGDK